MKGGAAKILILLEVSDSLSSDSFGSLQYVDSLLLFGLLLLHSKKAPELCRTWYKTDICINTWGWYSPGVHLCVHKDCQKPKWGEQ